MPAAGEQRLLAAGLVDQPLEVVPEVGLVLEPAAHARRVVGLGHDRRRGHQHAQQQRAGDHRSHPARVEPARGQPLHSLEHAHGAHAAQHADHGRGHDQVALVAGEARLGHHGHEQEPGQPEGRQRQRHRLGPAPDPEHRGVAHGDQRAQLDGCDRDVHEALEQRHRRDLLEGGRARVRGVGARAGTQRVARAPPLGQEPADRDQQRRTARAARAARGSSSTARARRGRGRARPRGAAARPGSRAAGRGRGGRRGGARRPTARAPPAAARSCPARRRARTCCSRTARGTRTRRRAPRTRRRRSGAWPSGRPSRSRTGRRPARPRSTGRGRCPGRRARTGAVNRIGNGFQDGPPSVTRSSCTISRPQRIQAQGS